MSTRTAIEEHSRRGEKIQAIKLFRDTTRWGLLDSKLAVEFFMAKKRWSDEAAAALRGEPAPTPAPAPAPATPSTPTFDLATVAELVRKKEKIPAIKELRRRTSLGLAACKAAVEAFADRGVWPPEIAALAGAASTPAPAPASPGEGLARAEAFARAGRKIDAIKAVREQTGLGLKDAKDFVEAFMAAGAWPPVTGGVRAPATPAAPVAPKPAAPPAPSTRAAPRPTPAAAPKPAPAPAPKPAPARAPLDPEAAEAVAALLKHTGARAIDQIHAVEKDFARGYLGILGERAFFVIKRFGDWDVEREYAKAEGVSAELRTGLSRVELRLRKTFLYDAITGLDEDTARAIARLLDDRAKV